MPQRREGLRPVFRLLGSLAVVLIPFGVYAYFYFEGQREYHINRNFRSLAEVGTHLSALLRQFESFFDFDPYNEIEETGYPIREMAAVRFGFEEEQSGGEECTVEDFLEKLEKVESKEEIKEFRSALKAALDKERDLRLLKNSLREELIKVELERFASRSKSESVSNLGRPFQSQTESDEELTKALLRSLPKLFREALERMKEKAKTAWSEVVKTQQRAICSSDKGAQDLPTGVQRASNRKAGAERREECNELACNEICFKAEDEKSKYIAALGKIQKDQSEELKKEAERLRRSPAYENLEVFSNEGGPCEQDDELTGLQVSTSKVRTSLSVISCQQKELSGLSQKLTAELPLADIMLNAAAEVGNFDLLVLAREDGRVLSSSETKSAGVPKSVFAKFTSLELFFQEDQSEAESKETDSDKENDQRDKDDHVSIPLVSVIREAEVSGEMYLLFLQPFQPPLPILPQPAEGITAEQSLQPESIWYLGGIIRESEFQEKYMAVPLIATGLSMLILILGVLSLPYIKMFFTSVGESLRASDIFFLVVSLVLGSGLITLLLLNTVTYHNMSDKFDKTAKNIKDQIKRQFEKELDDTLETFSHTLYIVRRGNFSILDKLFHTPKKDKSSNSPENGYLFYQPIHPPKKGEFFELPENGYPFYESVFLVEKHGGLEPDHWTTFRDRKPNRSIDISGRQYFIHARDERGLWRGKDFDFFIERVHSYTDGVKTSVVSAPYEKIQQKDKKDFSVQIHSHADSKRDSATSENNNGNEDFIVAALAKRFLSFRALALPPSFGFAVIEDNTGDVIFHSDDHRSLIENFFWETDENLEIQAAVRARQTAEGNDDDEIEGHYNGQKHRFFVSPIANLRWSLMVFYDTRLLETVNFEIGVTAVGIFFLYVVLFVFGTFIIHLFVPGKHWSWCWPRSEFRARYAYMVVLLVVIVLYYGLGIWFLEGWLLLLLVASLTMTVPSLLYSCFRLKRRDGTEGRKRYIARFILFLGATGGLTVWLVPKPLDQDYTFIRDVLVIGIGAWITLAPVWSKKLARFWASKLDFQFCYLSVALLSLFAVSVLPVAAVFKDTFLAQSERFAKFRQSEFATALEGREKALLGDMYGLARPDEVGKKINSESEKFVRKTIEPGLYKYEEDGICFYKTSQNGSCQGKVGDPTQKWLISQWFMDFLPVYNELAGKLRYPRQEVPDPSQSEEGIKIHYQASPSQLTFLPRGTPDYRITAYLCGFIFLLVLIATTRALARRIVGLRLPDFEEMGGVDKGTAIHKLLLPSDIDKKTIGPDKKAMEELAREWIDQEKKRRIVVRPPRCLISRLEHYAGQNAFCIIDLSRPTRILLGQLERWSSDSLPGILVTHFELSFLELRLRSALLRFLESKYSDTVILCSSVSPLYRLMTPEAYPESDKGTQDAAPEADEKLRWSALLSTFRKERFWYQALDWRKKNALSLAILSRECCWTDELIPIYDDLKDKVKGMKEEQIIHQVGDRAEAFYRKLWMLCTKEERLILIHLAQGDLVNLQNAEVVRRLLWRGLIRRDPDFRLPNESFARFVLKAELPTRIAEWEKGDAEGSTWAMLRAPLILLLVLVAAFIAQTGGEGLGAMTAIVSSVLAGLPIIIQALNFLRGGQTGKPVEE